MITDRSASIAPCAVRGGGGGADDASGRRERASERERSAQARGGRVALRRVAAE